MEDSSPFLVSKETDHPTSNGLDAARFPARLELLANEIHVVRLCLERACDGGLALLDTSERERSARFLFDRDRKRFIAAHAWMRVVLGRCLGCAAEALQFTAGSHNKPRLVDPPLDVRFNLSHAGERALLALTLGHEIGVDIEEERTIEVLELARRFFAPAESDELQALAPSEQRSAFFRCWTRKESFVKALGDGLAFPLDGFEVSLTQKDVPQLLNACSAAPQALQRWRIMPLLTEPGYTAALTVDAGAGRIVRWSEPAPDRAMPQPVDAAFEPYRPEQDATVKIYVPERVRASAQR